MNQPATQPDTAFDHHDRTEFQLERLILFTDAVFAIAITLLAIEIRVPEFHQRPSDGEIWYGMAELSFKFVGFFIGFGVIARFWLAHHRIFRFVRTYDAKLLSLNLVFLFFIVVMPFSSGLFGAYATVRAAFVFYAITVMLAGLAQMALQRYLRDPAHRLILPEDSTHPDLDLGRPLVPVVGFVLATVVVSLLPDNGRSMWLIPFTPLLTLPLLWLQTRRTARLRQYLAQREQPPVAEAAAPPPEAVEIPEVAAPAPERAAAVATT